MYTLAIRKIDPRNTDSKDTTQSEVCNDDECRCHLEQLSTQQGRSAIL